MSRTKRITALMLSALMLISLPKVSAENGEETKSFAEIGSDYSYNSYLESNAYPSANEDIEINLNSFNQNSGAELLSDYGGETTALKLSSGDSVTYNVTVPENGLYELELKYLCTKGRSLDAGLAVEIDNAAPYELAKEIILPRLWTNDGDKRTDSKGNEFAPPQKEADVFNTLSVYDSTGVENEPLRFALSAGVHTLKLTLTEEECVFSQIKLKAPTAYIKYEEKKSEYEKEGRKSADGLITIHAEDAVYKTKSSLVPKSNSNNSELHPSSVTNQLINYIGGANWSDPGDTLTWNIHVKKAGLYKLAYRYSQSEVTNGYVYRTLKIDGEVPFEEASEMAFYYNSGWKIEEFADENGKPYLIWLDVGDHTLSMSVTLGKISDYYRRLKDIAEDIGKEYLKILMITGENPDMNRDYALFEAIPDLEEVLKKNYDELISLAADMEQGNSTTVYSASLKNMARVLKTMLENKYDAHRYKQDYYDRYCTVSAWLNDMKDMSLSLDEIWLASPEADMKTQLEADGQTYKSSFLEKLAFGTKRFLVSFSEDYTLSEGDAEGTTLKLWINWGRDQAQALNLLIRESFTPDTGVNVKVELVDATLIQGMLTNNAPDIALQTARTDPVNYAMRGALYDLSSFEDFDEVCKRFQPTSTTPYMYNGGCYALPDTQNFYIMFYRKDILDELGIKIPTNWEEFISATTVLQRNNMDVYMPYTKIVAANTVSTGLGGLNLFSTFLSQSGVSIYNDDLSATRLNTADCINVFTYWSDFYTKYKLQTTMDFYNRFRLGVSPLGISVYTTYTTLEAAAPEIAGKWGISEIPGIVRENGALNNSVSGSGTGCVILNQSKHKEEAWEFLKWWTSADTQSKFSRELETILGPTGRIATSNIEAFNLLSWKNEDREILLGQWSKINELPEAPGSYYLPRSVDQAFWSVYNGKKNIGDALAEWGLVSDQEMLKKQKEYGLR